MATSIPPAWTQALEAWRVSMVAQGRAESTMAKRLRYVQAFARFCGLSDPFVVDLAVMVSWVDKHAGATSTASLYRQTLRVFYAWAHQAGHTTSDLAVCLTAVNKTRGSDLVKRQLGSSGPLPWAVPDGWQAWIFRWEREQRARGHSPQTIKTQGCYVRRLARDFPERSPFELSFYDLLDWIAPQQWSGQTRRSAQSSLRSFYSWAVEEELVQVSPAARLPKVIVAQPTPHPASEIAVHFAVLTATPRERLMVRLAAELGLRRNEVAQVHSRDLIQQDRGWSIIVHGKGSRDRVLPLPDELTADLQSLPPGWAFPSNQGGHLTAGYVGKRVKELLPEGVTMHALRHRFATRTYALTRDILVVQRLLGHAKPETTQRYVAVGDDDLRDAVTLLASTSTRSAAAVAV